MLAPNHSLFPFIPQMPALVMPAPQISAPQMPVSQMPAPLMPAPQMPVSQMPAPQMPALQMSAPQRPVSQMPAPQIPAPQMPVSQMPALLMPGSQMPAPQMPGSLMPAPQIPAPLMPVSQRPAPVMPAPIMPTPQMPVSQRPAPQMPASINVSPASQPRIRKPSKIHNALESQYSQIVNDVKESFKKAQKISSDQQFADLITDFQPNNFNKDQGIFTGKEVCFVCYCCQHNVPDSLAFPELEIWHPKSRHFELFFEIEDIVLCTLHAGERTVEKLVSVTLKDNEQARKWMVWIYSIYFNNN
jgi:hypothetical protein